MWKGWTSSLVGVAVAGAVGRQQGLEQIGMKIETGWRKRKKILAGCELKKGKSRRRCGFGRERCEKKERGRDLLEMMAR